MSIVVKRLKRKVGLKDIRKKSTKGKYKWYRVGIREVWEVTFEAYSISPRKAREDASRYVRCDDEDRKFIRSLKPSEWTVRRIKI